MKRLFAVAAVMFLMTAGSALAQDHMHSTDAMHRSGGLGFHNVEAPVGFRWWLSGQKVGIDLGFGFTSSSAESDGYPDERLNNWAVDLGVPFVMHSWTRAHILFRPGILYQSQEFTTTAPPTPFDTDNATQLTAAAEIEAEIFLVENISVSASHGIGFVNVDPGGGADNQTSFTTIGKNFTTVGFHMYFLGGSY